MSESNRADKSKDELIEQLLAMGVYKTSDERHLYDVPLKVLEEEYKMVNRPSEDTTSSWIP